MATVYKFKAYYKTDGVGAVQDPAPVYTVINMADDSKLADAQATTASTNMPGLYTYSYSGNDGLDCVAFFHTTDADADEADVASYVSDKITTNLNADVAGVETKIETIDRNVDSILADTGTDGVVLKAAGLATDAVTEIQSGLALEATLTAIKGKTDNLPSDPADESLLEAAITSAVATIRGVDSDSLKTLSDQIDGIDVSSVADAVCDELLAGHAIPGSVGEALSTAGSGSSAADIADAVLDELTAGHVIPGSLGKAITDLPDDVYDLLAAIPAVSLAMPAAGTELTAYAGDTLEIDITGLGNLSAADEIYVSMKSRYDDDDSESILQVTRDGGLRYLLGAAASSSTDGSLTVLDAVTGHIKIIVKASVTVLIPIKHYIYDVKTITGIVAESLVQGEISFKSTVTKAVS